MGLVEVILYACTAATMKKKKEIDDFKISRFNLNALTLETFGTFSTRVFVTIAKNIRGKEF